MDYTELLDGFAAQLRREEKSSSHGGMPACLTIRKFSLMYGIFIFAP